MKENQKNNGTVFFHPRPSIQKRHGKVIKLEKSMIEKKLSSLFG